MRGAGDDVPAGWAAFEAVARDPFIDAAAGEMEEQRELADKAAKSC